MNCPNCHKLISIKKQNVSINSDIEQEYDRIIYHCKVCDTWVTTEIPKNK